ncbi:phage tail protein [Kribbella antibiotica]|uniref:Phage tail protein n=1 Tax=Kribbella antibiotica TaxID=190195 RepID=A0A4R4ZU12_9ACTN|nr:macro domain-containing protein [Kribbella antibiotica]TDD61449.1 phage tail protein [Kribbella antibiotica]
MTRLLLVDLDEDLVAAWQVAFAAQIDEGTVEVRQGSLLDALPEVDAVLTAGNSYGQMDGGVDRALSQHWPSLQRSVWAALGDDFHGYLPVGSASVVPTGDDSCRWLVYAPTMRVPMPLVGGLDMAAHDAFWAALLAVGRIAEPVARIAAPGFGTGYGRLRPERAAQLMAAAFTLWKLPSTTQISHREALLRRREG